MGKTIQGGERTLILKVMQFFENEKLNKGFVIPVDQALKRAMFATGCSKRTLLRIKKEAANELAKQQAAMQSSSYALGEGPVTPEVTSIMDITLTTPGKKRRPSRRKITLDNFQLCALRDIIKNFQAQNNEKDKNTSSIKKIFAIAKQDLNFPGGLSTLKRVMKDQLGFQFKTVKKVELKNGKTEPVLAKAPATTAYQVPSYMLIDSAKKVPFH